MIKKILKVSGFFLGGLILLIALIATLFINLSPEFGGEPTTQQLAIFVEADNYKDGVFVNELPSPMDMPFDTVMVLMNEFMSGVPNDRPKANIEVYKIDSLSIIDKPDELTRVTWFGHSAFLLEIDGKNILLDPMLGEVAAPHPWLGAKRYNKELPISIDEMPEIDLVVISHDHYDHLDYGSIEQLKSKVKQFYTPLGVGAHLIAWGVEPSRVREFNWWDEAIYEGLSLKCTPSRHFSGRGLFDRAKTLWASWVIQGVQENIYFSGDGGYGPHFKEIGLRYGPFDFAMMECGQYNDKWKFIHMKPEQTVQASLDIKTKVMMPIHWGAFTLALHSWTDPIERVTVKAKEMNIPIATPEIGVSVIVGQETIPYPEWWVGK